MTFDPEFYGNYEHSSIQKTNYLLWGLLKSNVKLSSNGRAIVFRDPEFEEIPVILELARALKRVGVYPTTGDMVEHIRLAAELENLDVTTGWQILCATSETRRVCEAIVAEGLSVGGSQLLRLSENSPKGTIQEFQSLQEESGVAPVPGYSMRGNLAPCACIGITDTSGKLSSTAFAIMSHHAESRLSDWAHIGFLATREGHRGRGLSKHLMAQVMIDAFEKLQARYLWTGVKPDNVPSQAVCLACGMTNADWTALFVSDPNVVGSSFTR